VVLAALALVWLMAYRGRVEISCTDMPLLPGGLLVVLMPGAAVLSQHPKHRFGFLSGGLILLAIAASVSN